MADQAIPRIMAHEGSLVIHAAAVALDGKAFALMGDTGAGKSTLSASFATSPATLLGDDAIVLSWSEGRPMVRAIYPSLRLLPDSVNALFSEETVTTSLAHYTDKRRVEVPVGFHETISVPVSALFVLDPAPSPSSVDITPLPAAEACVSIVRNSFALDPTDLKQAQRRLEEAGRLANCAPSFLLSYPRDYCTNYGLDPIGTRIWALLKEGLPPSEICARIAEEYDVDRDVAETDARRFLEDLKSNGIIEAA